MDDNNAEKISEAIFNLIPEGKPLEIHEPFGPA